MQVERAHPEDLPGIKRLLKICALSTAGLDEGFDNFWIVRHGDEIVGSVGLERYGESGMLRSFAVSPSFRNQGLGRKLLETLLDFARGKGLARIILLTKSASGYFARYGFYPVDRQDVDRNVLESSLFLAVYCPGDTIMRYDLH